MTKAVSTLTETPLEEMPPLQETVDCDALEALFDSFNVDYK
ncbi:HalOD1 output domain-containing protein [Haladaptatus sp. NG-WS-4]